MKLLTFIPGIVIGLLVGCQSPPDGTYYKDTRNAYSYNGQFSDPEAVEKKADEYRRKNAGDGIPRTPKVHRVYINGKSYDVRIR